MRVSGASPYALHDTPTAISNMTASERRGEHLFQVNCAFCHAADGTARNWIGSFLEPRPRDLTGEQVAALAHSHTGRFLAPVLTAIDAPAQRDSA